MNADAARQSKLLIVSVALNVFLVGAMVGGAYRWTTTRPAPPASAAPHPRTLRAAAATLSDGRRLQLREALRHTSRINRPLILSAQAGRRDVVAALKAQPFDPAALDAALARTRTADAALRVQIEQAIGGFAAGLSAEERARLVDAMERSAPVPRGDSSNG